MAEETTEVLEKPNRKKPIIKETSIVMQKNGKHTFHNPTKVEIEIYRKFDNGGENGMQFMYRRKKVCILTLVDKETKAVLGKRQGIGWSRWFPYPKKYIKTEVDLTKGGDADAKAVVSEINKSDNQ